METATIVALIAQSITIIQTLVDLLQQQGVSTEQLERAIAEAAVAHKKLQETL